MADLNVTAIEEASSNGIMIDIGAKSGNYTYRMAEKASQVFAFEPAPDNAKDLREVMSNRPNVEVIEEAVSNESGKTRLMLHPHNPGGHSIHTPLEGQRWNHSFDNAVEVTTTTLDKFCKNRDLKNIVLIKIDVEAHEKEVLEGAKATLKKFHPILALETHLVADLKGAAKILEKCGYDVPTLKPDAQYCLKQKK